jgi:long-chain acyl-CoA synthetase
MEVFESLTEFKERIALLDAAGVEISYGELIDKSIQCVEKIPIKSLVFLLCDNDFQSVYFYIGMLNKGIVPLLLAHDMTREKLGRLLSEFEPNFIIGKSEHIQSEFSNELIAEYGFYSLLKIKSRQLEIHSKIALLLTTSGSTGNPSLVCLSRDNLRANANSIIAGLGISPMDTAITTLPMNYSYGLSIINTHLIAGATILLNKQSVAEKNFWDVVDRFKPTSMGGVPYSYEILTRFKPDFFASKSIRKFTQAGGKLSSDLVEKMLRYCEQIQGQFNVMYGQTEATARMSIAGMDDLKISPSTVGRAILGTSFEIRDDANQVITQPGVSGELIFCGPNVSLGIANTFSDLGLGDLNKGELRTGDIAHFDENGLLYIDGRLKRFAKLFGHRISLDDVERFLASKEIECVAFSSFDNLVIATIDQELTRDTQTQVAEFLSTPVSAIKCFKVSAFPRSSSGKLMYKSLEEIYLSGDAK